jgi:hypothetical protein
MGKLKVIWEQFQTKVSDFNPVLLNPEVEFSYINKKSIVKFTCPVCYKDFILNTLKPILWGDRKSCGCLRKNKPGRLSNTTYKMACDALEKRGSIMLNLPEDLNQLILHVCKKGQYLFKCLKCDQIWGKESELYKVFSGKQNCPCVKKENIRLTGFKRRGVTTPARTAAGAARKGKKMTPAHYAASCLAAKKRYHISYFDIASQLLKVGAYPVIPFEGLVSTTQKILCCCSCQEIFYAKALHLKNGATRSCGCLKSFPEIELFAFIKELCPDAIKNAYGIIKYYNRSKRQLDIWISSKKFAIELDSKWHGELKIQSENRHKLSSFHKNRICNENGIRLMTIYADEWTSKKEIIKNYIKSILSDDFIDSEKCYVVNGGNNFTSKYHVEGRSPGDILSLIYNENIVAAATFKKLNDNLKSDVHILTRYCINGVSIKGGLNKILQHFWQNNPEAKHIVSISDNRLSAGNLYIKSGFHILEEIEPFYYYYVKGKRKRKELFNKDALAAKGWLLPNETEWECMQRLGHDRVWDCGKIKWGLERPDLKVATRSESSNYII